MQRRSWIALLLASSLVGLGCQGDNGTVEHNPNPPKSPYGRVELVVNTNAKSYHLVVKAKSKDGHTATTDKWVGTTVVPPDFVIWSITYDKGAHVHIELLVSVQCIPRSCQLEVKLTDVFLAGGYKVPRHFGPRKVGDQLVNWNYETA